MKWLRITRSRSRLNPIFCAMAVSAGRSAKTDSPAFDLRTRTPRNRRPLPTLPRRWTSRLQTGDWLGDREAFETGRLQSLTVPLGRSVAHHARTSMPRANGSHGRNIIMCSVSETARLSHPLIVDESCAFACKQYRTDTERDLCDVLHCANVAAFANATPDIHCNWRPDATYNICFTIHSLRKPKSLFITRDILKK